jgi:hypothetical protein
LATQRPVGRRLAIAAAALIHDKKPLTGPTITGCTLSKLSSEKDFSLF